MRIRSWSVVGVLAMLAVGCGSNNGLPGTGGKGGGAGGVSGGSGGHAASGGSPGGAGGAGGVSGGSGGHAASGGSPGGAGGATGSGGVPGSGGVTGSGGMTGTGGAGGMGMLCGGIAGVQCTAFGWCDFPGDTCGTGDQQGECRPRDAAGYDCTTPVCACDGRSYKSACTAHQNGTDAISTNRCIPGNGGVGAPCGADVDCRTGFKCCPISGAFSAPIACTQVATGAQCPALP